MCQSYINSVFVRGLAKRAQGPRGFNKRMRMQKWRRESGMGGTKMQARVTESGNGKLDHQFFFSIHFDLRDCTVSIGCDLGYLQRKRKTEFMWSVPTKKKNQIPITSDRHNKRQDKNSSNRRALDIIKIYFKPHIKSHAFTLKCRTAALVAHCLQRGIFSDDWFSLQECNTCQGAMRRKYMPT